MADQKNEDRESKSSDYQPPKGAASDNSLRAGGSSISYKASADWLILRKKEKPKAEMFHVSYIAEGDGSRPITFVFNGGPGASSVYLHLGAMGPGGRCSASTASRWILPPGLRTMSTAGWRSPTWCSSTPSAPVSAG
jgi:carboxypeptidase C (cathepsin A)